MAHLKTQIFCLNSLTHTLLFAALETNALIYVFSDSNAPLHETLIFIIFRAICPAIHPFHVLALFLLITHLPLSYSLYLSPNYRAFQPD